MTSKKSTFTIVTLLIFAITGFGFYLLDSYSSDQRAISQKKQNAAADIDTTQYKDMVVAGGCFWCVEADMEKAPGVIEVVSGYSGGENENPNYDNYAEAGHREVARVVYNPQKVSYKGLLYYFIKHIDPTDGQGSFSDRGEQYSPAIYYENQAEKKAARDVLDDIASRGVFEEDLKVPVLQQQPFWKASEYHQNFYLDNTIQYKIYRKYSGRSGFIEQHWGEQADVIPDSLVYDSRV